MIRSIEANERRDLQVLSPTSLLHAPDLGELSGRSEEPSLAAWHRVPLWLPSRAVRGVTNRLGKAPAGCQSGCSAAGAGGLRQLPAGVRRAAWLSSIMRLRHGVTVEQAINALDEVIRRSNDPRTFGLHEVRSKLNQLLWTWVNASQGQFRAVFADTELEDLVLSRGYWHLATATIPSYPQELGRLIDDELVFQAGHPGVPGDRGGRLGEVANAWLRGHCGGSQAVAAESVFPIRMR